MTNFFQNVDLTGNSLNIWFALDAIFFQNFDGNFFPSNRMSPDSDFPKRSLSEWSS